MGRDRALEVSRASAAGTPTKLIYTEILGPRFTLRLTTQAQLRLSCGHWLHLTNTTCLEKWTMNIFALLNSTKLDMRILCFKESRQIQIQDLTFPAPFPTLHMTGHHERTALGVFLLFLLSTLFLGFQRHTRTPYKQTLTVW